MKLKVKIKIEVDDIRRIDDVLFLSPADPLFNEIIILIRRLIKEKK